MTPSVPALSAIGFLASLSLAACATHLAAPPPRTAPAPASAPSPSIGEDAAREAEALVQKGDLVGALRLFRQAWDGGYRNRGEAYDAACAASLSGLTDEAVEWLLRSSALGGHNLAAVDLDTDLDAVRKLPRWPDVRAKLAAEAEAGLRREGVTEVGVRYELDAMAWDDQKAREAAIKSSFKDPKAIEVMKATDSKHLPRLKELLETYGWLGTRLVGKEGASHFWLLVQHMDADIPFQHRVLDLMTAAAAKGEASKTDLAYLTDRVLISEKKPQRYGTQFGMSEGALKPFPIEDPAGLEERRKSVGLGTMAEYASQLHTTYAPGDVMTPPASGNAAMKSAAP